MEGKDIQFVYTKERSLFGRQCLFDDYIGTQIDIRPDPELMKEYMYCFAADRGFDDPHVLSQHEVNTEYLESIVQGVNHAEGGWPKDVNFTDVDQVTRHRKKIEREEGYTPAVKILCDAMEHCVLQNNAIDIYQHYFAHEEVPSEDETSASSLKVYSIFRDPNEMTRPVNQVSWHPDGPERLVVAHCPQEFQCNMEGISTDSYIWRTEDISAPEMILRPWSPALCLKYNPKDANCISGGLYNGQMAIWDVRRGMYPVDSTELSAGHIGPIYACTWISSKSGNEIFTVSTDGQVLLWNLRKLTEPIEQYYIDPTKTQDKNTSQGGLVLDYDATLPTKFMVGTESGTVMIGNRKAKTPAEKITTVYEAHIGPVTTLQRSPFNAKLFLTTGAWKAKIWSEDIKDVPIVWTCNQSYFQTNSCWSPNRPLVFFTCTLNGEVHAWDHLFKFNEPAASIKICDEPLCCLAIEEQGELLCVGSALGTTTILQLSHSLYALQKNEKTLFSFNIERECKREKSLEAKARERKVALGRRQSNDTMLREQHERLIPNREYIRQIDKDFFDMINKERRSLTIKPPRIQIKHKQQTKITDEERAMYALVEDEEAEYAAADRGDVEDEGIDEEAAYSLADTSHNDPEFSRQSMTGSDDVESPYPDEQRPSFTPHPDEQRPSQMGHPEEQ